MSAKRLRCRLSRFRRLATAVGPTKFNQLRSRGVFQFSWTDHGCARFPELTRRPAGMQSQPLGLWKSTRWQPHVPGFVYRVHATWHRKTWSPVHETSHTDIRPGTPAPGSGIYELMGPRGGRTGEEADRLAESPCLPTGRPGETHPETRVMSGAVAKSIRDVGTKWRFCENAWTTPRSGI
jgi:hypothetical protein